MVIQVIRSGVTIMIARSSPAKKENPSSPIPIDRIIDPATSCFAMIIVRAVCVRGRTLTEAIGDVFSVLRHKNVGFP